MDRRDLRRSQLVAALACLSLAAIGDAARAQALDTLHVRSFLMTADTLTPRVGQSFHLTISAHVDEQITELNNVTLPDLSSFDGEGDERRCVASVKGSDCTETIVLVPKVAGPVTIASATMDAVDASDHKPSRFATNSLRLQIGNAPVTFALPQTGDAYDLFWSFVRAFFVLVILVTMIYVLLRYFARPRPKAPVVATVPAVIAAPVVAAPRDDFDAEYRKLVEALRADPTRPRALAVRHALRYTLGAGEQETLADLVRRDAAHDRPRIVGALRAIERACFCEDGSVEPYAREALPFLTI
jgi:hypothetical protein